MIYPQLKTRRSYHERRRQPEKKSATRTRQEQPFLTLSDLYDFLPDYRPSEILRLIRKGQIPYYESEGQFQFKRSEIDGWLELNKELRHIIAKNHNVNLLKFLS